MKKRHFILSACFAVMTLSAIAPNPVLAENVLPPVVDEYRVLTDDWNINHKSQGPIEESYSLSVTRGGKSYSWPIDFQFQFSTLKHESDDVAEEVINHLKETEESRTFGPLVVKLASYKKGGALFIRDLDIFNAYDSWKKASKFGSPMLGESAKAIERMGLDKYKKRCQQASDKQWQEVVQR